MSTAIRGQPKARNARNANRAKGEIRYFSTIELRARIAQFATEVAATGAPIFSGPSKDRPIYLLQSAMKTQGDVIAAAVPIGPDKARKTFATIRALLRTDDRIWFGLMIGGQVVAILRRHPDFTNETAREYRRISEQRRPRIDTPDVELRVSALEAAMKLVVAKVSGIEDALASDTGDRVAGDEDGGGNVEE